MILLDTHVVAWLYTGEVERLSRTAERLVEEEDLLVSPAVSMELQYLQEIGRMKEGAHSVLSDLEARIGLKVAADRFIDVVRMTLPESWTRDPFDRLQVGHAKLLNVRLLTKDKMIHKHFNGAVW